MKKILLVGPAGCGKTHAVLDDLETTLRGSDPLEPDTFFIVPSAEHTERVISLLIQRGAKGFFHQRVTTLSRIASDIFQATDVPVATSLTRALIIRELFAENDWEYFREVRDQPGFLDLFLQLVSELKEARVDSGKFRTRMNDLKKFEPDCGTKYEALAAAYEHYEAKLKARGFRDAQDGLDIYLERKARGNIASRKFRALWLDGFFDFSNLQLEYLKVLSSMTETMTVTLTKDEGAGREEVFEIIEGTQKRLESLGFTAQKMKSRNFRTKDAALLHLQNNLFSEKGTGRFLGTGSPPVLSCESKNGRVPVPLEKSACPPASVTFLEAVGIEGEIELIAREIHKLYSAGGYRYSDFAVLFRQVRNYGRVIAAIFSRYGIPTEIHERERLKFSSWIAAATALLTVFREGWKRDDVFAFLRSGHVRKFGGIAKDETWLADLESKAFEQGICPVRQKTDPPTLSGGGSRDAWLAPWRCQIAEKENELFNRRKGELFGLLAGLEDRFRVAQSVEEHIGIFKDAVYRIFGVLEISDENTPFVRRDAVSVRRFETLLDEIRANVLKGKSKVVSFESFADQFLGLVELDVYSLHERDKNRVQVYDVSLARQKEYRVVFVAGLLEKVFPLRIRENALLSDWERRIVSSGLEHPLQECLPRQSLERYLFYLAVTRASERLFLSYPHTDLEGKESLPSFYLEEVSGLFGGKIRSVKQDLSRPFPSFEEAITKREREAAIVGELRNACEKGTGSPAEGGVPVPLEKSACPPISAESRARILNALVPVEAEIRDEKIRDGKYFELHEASPTRLEDYAKCPYRYFSHRVLKLQDPTEDVTVRQKGTILHWVLEEYFREFLKAKGKAPSPKEFTERKLKEAFGKFPLISERKYREELDRADVGDMLLPVLQKEMERLGISELRPAYLEYNFGPDPKADAPPLKLQIGQKELKLQGRIDRIDVDKARKLGLVVDYKRTAQWDKSALELGTALQLPLYILAMEKNLGLEPLGGELYSLKENKRTGFYNKEKAEKIEGGFSPKSLMPEADFRKVIDRTVEFVGRFAREIKELRILVRPRDVDFCKRICPYQAVCRIEKWRLPLILQEIKEEEKKVTPSQDPVFDKSKTGS